MCNSVDLVQTSGSKGLLLMVRLPAHGPLVDVVLLATSAWAPSLFTLSILNEVLLAISHCSREGAVVSHRDERQPPKWRWWAQCRQQDLVWADTTA